MFDGREISKPDGPSFDKATVANSATRGVHLLCARDSTVDLTLHAARIRSRN